MVPAIERYDWHSGDRLTRRHRAIRGAMACGQLLIGGRPAGESVGELAEPMRRFARGEASRGMPDADHAMRRRGAKARRETLHPAIEDLPPLRLFQLFGEERAPVGEA